MPLSEEKDSPLPLSSMATIKAIEARSIHQIQSGQVIVDLCSVVKELVENSIDAGATHIDVRFRNQGLDSIEVQDNGSGISKENYETLALKHYTSKLSTYADLESLETFGFRGEALSSLCALSRFSVTTCLASDAPKGSRLEYEISGKLGTTSIVAAQKGTTMIVEGLFHNLPVRRRELERNIKREWNKVLGVLNQYACIQTGLKFSVSQQPTKGKRMILFSTKGNQTTRENIVNVFGAKTLNVLIPLDLELELEPTTTSSLRIKSKQDEETKLIRVRGHVSRPAYGEGRQTPDRQMFFVNGRPCGLPQFAKVFNEVYRSYNSSQSPFIFADLRLDTHLYDVNVSPDKRTILLHDQTRMLDNLKESLSTLFESQDYALPTSQLQSFKRTPFKQLTASREATVSSDADSGCAFSLDSDVKRGGTFASPQAATEVHDGDDASGASSKTPQSVEQSTPQAVPTSHFVSDWAERKCGTRADNHGIGNNEGTGITTELDHAHSQDLQSPSENVPLSDQPSIHVSSDVTDFRTRLAELKKRNDNDPPDDITSSEEGTDEPPIPALSIPARTADFKNAMPRTSSWAKRASPEVATITIGNHTVTSMVGSSSKRQRVESRALRDSSTTDDLRRKTPMPSFNGRLTQMFAAQSARQQSAVGQFDVATSDDSENSDSSSEQLFVEDDQDMERSQEEDNDESAAHESSPASPKDSPLGTKSDRESEEPAPSPADGSDEGYQENMSDTAKGERDIQTSVEISEQPQNVVSDDTQKRTQSFIKGGTKKKDATCQLRQTLRIDEHFILNSVLKQQEHLSRASSGEEVELRTDQLDADDAEETLSLTISKADFGNMKIIGQFNHGFILASRMADNCDGDAAAKSNIDDELFIIDQHATDEKYNFERLQASTIVQSQRLVRPKTLELTAVEEDTVQQNLEALEKNGFVVEFDDSGHEPVGTRCQLLSLPLSRETTFSLADLEELISLLGDHSSNSAVTVPRPSKVRKMFAMRACRSSVMIGKPLSVHQMEKLVRHMGELDKPWNCPHGRPTMRHLCGLGAWDQLGWKEGDGFDDKRHHA
ncbi:DNA mismatch repair protein MutL [Xylariaceae sp. FL1019]|nr:DNA mismatch repair protein MutL [Xylariaceae sp. FL1019]